MKSFREIFSERANRIVALSQISQIALEGLGQISKNSESPFAPMFKKMAAHIPEGHQNHPDINIPEFRVVSFLDGLTLIATISEVEAYFQDLIVAVLLKHPEKAGKTSFDLKILLELSSIDDVKMLAAERFASDMLFKRPNDYKKDLMTVLSADEALFKKTWPIFVEAKCRRDLGVHNGWVVNDIYRSKVREVGVVPTTEDFLSINHEYLHSVREGCVDLMIALANHCKNKFR